MKAFNRFSALLMALLIMLATALPALGETAAQTGQATESSPQESAAPEAPVTDEATPEEAQPEASPAPFATMAPLKKDEMPQPNAEAKAEAIVTDPAGADLFELPAHESAVLAQLDPGAVLVLSILGQSWSKVESGGVAGYVPTQSLGFAYGAVQPGIAVVTASNGKLTLRAQMTTKSKALASIPSGRAVLLLAKGEVFSLVRFEGKEGYALTEHLKEVPVGATLGTYTQVVSIEPNREANVALRAAAKKGATVYTRIKSGNSLVVLGIEEGWAQVEYEGYHGYMMAEYLKRFD